MYQLVFSKQATKALRKLPKPISQLIRAKLDELAKNPYETHLDVATLRNRPGYRLRVRDWRIIYRLEDDKLLLLVVKVGARGDVYKR